MGSGILRGLLIGWSFCCAIGSPSSAQSLAPTPTKQQRLNEYLRGLVNPIAVIGSAAGAGIGQWRDSPPEWGQGGAGYGARFASSFSGHIVQQTILSGTAACLGEDTRYIHSGQRGFKRRLKYALASTVMARANDGSRRLSLSQMGSFAGGAFLSRLWQPPSTGGAADGVASLAASVGVAAGFNVVREFVPRLFWRLE
jgi:hypothetical protein